MKRHYNGGLRKLCDCSRRNWSKCPHGWHFNFKPRFGPFAGQSFRFSLDAELGEHIGSKEEAKSIADRIRGEIRDGTFVRAKDRPAQPTPDAVDLLTIETLGKTYFKDYKNKKAGGALSKNEQYRWDLVMRTEITRTNGVTVRFGDLDVRQITRHDIEAFKAAHLVVRTETFKDAKGREHVWRRGGPVGVNRCLGRLRSFYSWAVKDDHVMATPFKKGTETVVEMYGELKRERRLAPAVGENGKSEEERLIAAANPHLAALVTAALETGCRVGELLSLQWWQVRFDLNEIHLPAKKTKALRRRDLPMSQRLKALLEMRRTDSDGQDYKAQDYVFGDQTGARVKSVKTAWENAVLKAHGYTVEREATGRLTPACREAFAAIDLNFHDLRREAGSQFLEHGMAPHYVQAFLDHADLSTTSRYLNITAQGMHAALKRVEAARCKPVANSESGSTSPRTEQPEKSLQ